MAIDDLWVRRDGTPTKRNGRGLRYRVRVEGYPTSSHRTSKEAERINAQRIAAGPPTPKSTVTVGDMLDRWLAGKRALSPNGFKACSAAARQAREHWGSVLAADVTRTDVQEWIGSMTSLDLSKRPEDGQPQPVRPAAGSTRAKALQALSGALEIAIDLGAIDANPCRKVSAGRQARRAVETLTPAELAGLAAAAGKRDEAMVWALGTCGIRIGEACALDVGDVDVRRRRLMVRKAKDGEPREVPIPESVLGRLALKGRDRSEPLFLSPAGKRIDPHNWRPRVFDKAAKRIGRPDITPHVLRHTAASLAIRSGADVKAVQRMLGHATAKLTLDTYGHLWDAGLDDVATRMDGLIGGGDG